ncbi:MAG TPA: protein kinase, partial [Bacteroidota bacterium]
GTLAYMAPEQIQGGDVDARSDLFSFGVVLYEMLTGQFPFRGEHEAAMMYSILNEEPTPLPSSLSDATPELGHILSKALDKDPEDRYQSAKEVAVDLRRLKKDTSRVVRRTGVVPQGPQQEEKPKLSSFHGLRMRFYALGVAALVVVAVIIALLNPFSPTRPGSSEKRMLVVLPFQNQGSSEMDYFVDGITEEVTSRLSGLSGLGVIARSSAIQYKGTSKPLKQIGEELGVSYALMGTVRWEKTDGSEDRIRVNPELINISDATQVWSEPFEASYSGGFKLQAQIASQVATALGISLLTPERQSLEATLTDNSEAYDFYLKGNDYADRGGEDNTSLSFAEQMYNRALELDPGFAAAYARLSIVHSNAYWFHFDRSEQRVLNSKRAAEAALRLDPNLALAHTAMGSYHYHGRLDYDQALKSYQKSMALQPNDTETLIGIGAVLRRQGKMEESLPYFEKAVEVDPRSSRNVRELAYTQEFLRMYEEAHHTYERAVSIAPDELVNYILGAWIQVKWKSDLEGARAILATAVQKKVPNPDRHIEKFIARLEYLGRNYQKADEVLRSAGPIAADDQYYFVPSSLLRGLMARFVGNTTRAAVLFDSARVNLEAMIKADRSDTRYYSALAIALAGLGRKEDAIKKAREAVDLMPISKEALRGTARLYDLAYVYAMVDEKELALDQLERAPVTGGLFLGEIRLDPVWDPLRDHPRFKRFLESESGL